MNTRGNEICLLDVVALIDDVPEHDLIRGQVGTVVELLDENVYLVEFSDKEGRTYAVTSLESDKLILLHYDPIGSA